MSDYPSKRDCEHGNKRGSCELCDCYEQIEQLKRERDDALRESKGSLIVLDGLKRRIRAAFEVWPGLAMFRDLSCLLNLKPSAVKLKAHNLEQQIKGIEDFIDDILNHLPAEIIGAFKAYSKDYLEQLRKQAEEL